MSRAFNEWASEQAPRWAAEQRAWDAFEAAAQRFVAKLWELDAKAGLSLTLPGTLCIVDERLRPPCPSS